MFFAKSKFRTKMVILAGLEAILEPLGTILGPLGAVLGRSWDFWPIFGGHLGGLNVRDARREVARGVTGDPPPSLSY